MRLIEYSRVSTMMLALALLSGLSSKAADGPRMTSVGAGSIWAHDNLYAWEVAPFDSMKRGPEERAQMLETLGFKHYAHLATLSPKDSPADSMKFTQSVDSEIEALQRHGILGREGSDD